MNSVDNWDTDGGHSNSVVIIQPPDFLNTKTIPNNRCISFKMTLFEY